MNWYNLFKFAAIKLLHGTSSNFTEFDLSFAGQRDWGDYGTGVYLTTNDYMARSYAHESAKNHGGNPVVYLVEANVSNLANMDDPNLLSIISQETNAPFPKKLEPGKPQSRPEGESRDIREFLIKLGYDGVIVRDIEYVVFDPAKIKILKAFDLTDNSGDLTDNSDIVPFWLDS